MLHDTSEKAVNHMEELNDKFTIKEDKKKFVPHYYNLK